MPVQKGKKHKKPRHRARDVANGEQTSAPIVAPTRSTTARRPRRRMPPWFNAGLGIFMLIAGLFFFFVDQKTMALKNRALILGLYLVIGAVYLGSAIRAYRQKRQT